MIFIAPYKGLFLRKKFNGVQKRKLCHSEPFFLDGRTKNLYAEVTFEILRGKVYDCPSQNDRIYFSFFTRGEELFSESVLPLSRSP